MRAGEQRKQDRGVDSRLEQSAQEDDPYCFERRGSVVALVMRQQGIDRAPPQNADEYEQVRFVTRARTLFFTRLAFLGLGLGVLAIPAWSNAFGVQSLWAFAVYFAMVAYSALNFALVEHPRLGKPITFTTLCLDLIVMVYMIAVSGALGSPLLVTQLLFTTLFVILFPKPLAIIPPLLTLPIVAKIDQLMYGSSAIVMDLFVLLWYSAINFIVVYLMVYLNEQETSHHRDVVSLHSGLRRLAIIEERNRLAREIHDGLGASMSSLIIQSEYLQNISAGCTDESVRAELIQEIQEMKSVAEESIDELRRNVSMMREDFDLLPALEDYCRTFQSRNRIKTTFEHQGNPPELQPHVQLTIFRILQECLTNVIKHADTDRVSVRLVWIEPNLVMTITDYGKGFDAHRSLKNHYGLTNMRERARSIGGVVTIESDLGHGTTVRLSIHL